MDIETLLADKSIRPKEKTETISQWLLDAKIDPEGLIKFAGAAKDQEKATCIEAMEFATKLRPEIADTKWLDFVSGTLTAKAPRVKWESAKVIGNIAHLFPGKLDVAVVNLLTNAEHPGTVVRWSAAFALGEILKTRHPKTQWLIPAVEAICEREEKNSIRKIYLAALKKIKT